jgi:hypothetical protein
LWWPWRPGRPRRAWGARPPRRSGWPGRSACSRPPRGPGRPRLARWPWPPRWCVERFTLRTQPSATRRPCGRRRRQRRARRPDGARDVLALGELPLVLPDAPLGIERADLEPSSWGRSGEECDREVVGPRRPAHEPGNICEERGSRACSDPGVRADEARGDLVNRGHGGRSTRRAARAGPAGRPRRLRRGRWWRWCRPGCCPSRRRERTPRPRRAGRGGWRTCRRWCRRRRGRG